MHENAANSPLPPYQGVNVAMSDADDLDPPLVRLVKKLYTSADPTSECSPTLCFKDLPLFSYAHEEKLLREPFTNERAVSTRSCSAGDGCVGRNNAIPGHYETNVNGKHGVILTELMDPSELQAFYDQDTLPQERRMCLLCARYHVHTAYLHARKSKTFPVNAHINSYVNASGENEYAQEFLIPTPDDSSWAGVVGTTAGLHLNALKLVKGTADNIWHIDQWAMKHVVRTQSNISYPLLYRNAVEPRVWLRNFYRNRSRLLDADILFSTYDELCSVRPKLPTENIKQTYMRWPANAVKSFMHRLLFYRINRLNQMLVELGPLHRDTGDAWSYNMQLYVDAHVSMVIMCEEGQKISSFVLKYPAYEATLPDLSTLMTQAAMNIVVPPGLSAVDRKKEVLRPRALLIQMLVRSMPEYSQTRMLHSHFIKCLQNRDLSSVVFSILQCCLLGNYESVRERVPYATRKKFISEFTEQNAVAMIKSMPVTEHLLLYVMRSYIFVSITCCPALAKLFITISPLQKQLSKVADSLRMVRAGASQDWRSFFSEELLDSLRKNHKRLPKKKIIPRGLSDRSDALATNAKRAATKRQLKREHGAAFDIGFYQDCAKRAKHGDAIPETLVKEFDGPARAILAKIAAQPTKKPSIKLDAAFPDVSIQRLCDFSAALDNARLFRITPFPTGFVQLQLQAVADRFSCAIDDWTVLRRATRILSCSNCGIRNFSMLASERNPPTPATRRINNSRAAGYQKLACDVNTGELRCVECAACKDMPLISIDLIEPDGDSVKGGALILRDKAVMLSPCCGHLSATASIRLTPTGWDCACCAATKRAVADETPDPRICFHCSKRSQLKLALTQTVLLRDEKGRVQTTGFCKTHFRSWARTQSGYLTAVFVSKNMMNRSGNGLVLAPT